MIIDVKELDFFIDEAETLEFTIDDYVNIAPSDEPYPGPYTVIPKTTGQVLDTKHKRMTDDVTVTEIPYAEVGNVYGTTVTIAS